MTDEQAVREWLQRKDITVRWPNSYTTRALALLDAKDAEIAKWKAACVRRLNFGLQAERDTALSRAEQAEAALAEERKAHQAFREEVSEAAEMYSTEMRGHLPLSAWPVFSRFILPAKPAVDPLVEVIRELRPDDHDRAADWAGDLRAAIERAGGTISFEKNG